MASDFGSFEIDFPRNLSDIVSGERAAREKFVATLTFDTSDELTHMSCIVVLGGAGWAERGDPEIELTKFIDFQGDLLMHFLLPHPINDINVFSRRGAGFIEFESLFDLLS